MFFFFSGTFSLIQDTVNMTTVSHVYVDIKGAVVKPHFSCIKRINSIRAAVLPPGRESVAGVV